ncbi:hypothetical protein GY45DRAFT_762485 [Cubamyces sp. BRFM 1775]|nr:hypothetical protein GY45DRAFT_762485 [Cubamyces sp. BRFM 1775]
MALGRTRAQYDPPPAGDVEREFQRVPHSHNTAGTVSARLARGPLVVIAKDQENYQAASICQTPNTDVWLWTTAASDTIRPAKQRLRRHRQQEVMSALAVPISDNTVTLVIDVDFPFGPTQCDPDGRSRLCTPDDTLSFPLHPDVCVRNGRGKAVLPTAPRSRACVRRRPTTFRLVLGRPRAPSARVLHHSENQEMFR